MAQPAPQRPTAAGTIYRSGRSAPVDPAPLLTALLRGIADRDCAAFAALYATLAPALWSDVVDGGFSPADADAVLATTFLAVWQLARFEVDDDAQFVEWLRRSVGRRCAERRMRGAGPGAPAAGTDMAWRQAAEQYDRAAKQALKDLLDGRLPAGPSPDGRLAAAVPAPPASAPPAPAPADNPPGTRRPRRVDLGAAAAFGHRRAGSGPAG